MSIQKRLYDLIDELMPEIQEISEYIFNHPELGDEEFESSKYLVNKLKEHGFEVQYPYLDMPTAFRAEYRCGNSEKNVCFLPEYDALPGYGPEGNDNAHACGHNWIAANSLGAAIALSKMADELNGTIVVIGTPAEETTGGKCELVDKGAFDDIDAAIQMHLGAENNNNIVTLAMDSLEFNFKGVPAHAAAYPYKGINALDAVQLMFAGVNAYRQQMRNDARVCGIITDGGQACNIIPDRAGCQFYIRAAHKEYLKVITDRIIDCAKGAALMTGAELEYHNFENSYDDLVYDAELKANLQKNLEELGVTGFVDSDIEASGSSDVGNVSHACPTVYCEIATGANPSVFCHTEEFLPYVHGENAQFTLAASTKAMAYTAVQAVLGK